jgi:hypothetical protein
MVVVFLPGFMPPLVAPSRHSQAANGPADFRRLP